MGKDSEPCGGCPVGSRNRGGCYVDFDHGRETRLLSLSWARPGESDQEQSVSVHLPAVPASSLDRGP